MLLVDRIEQRLKEAQDELNALKKRIVYRQDISEVTKKLSALAVKYNVEINDFSPALDSYFEERGNEKTNNRINYFPSSFPLFVCSKL